MNAHRIPASDSPTRCPSRRPITRFRPPRPRTEARIALLTLSQDLRNLRRQPGKPLVYVPNLLLRGLQSLPVEWDVA